MNDATEPADQRTSTQHSNQDQHPEVQNLLFRPPIQTDDDWDYIRRGPRRLTSIGNSSWIRRASHERLARQEAGQDGEYTHRWWIKDQCSPKTSVIAEDAQALANTWGQPLRRSKDEPKAEPVFSPTEIRFNARENGCDDFRYPPDQSENEPAGSNRPATAAATRKCCPTTSWSPPPCW